MSTTKLTDAMQRGIHRQPEPIRIFCQDCKTFHGAPRCGKTIPERDREGDWNLAGIPCDYQGNCRCGRIFRGPKEAVKMHRCKKCDEEARNYPIPAPSVPASSVTDEKGAVAAKPKGRRKRGMNRTEAAFSLILEAKKSAGEILSWHYEGMTLRWGTLDSIAYTADFLVFSPAGITLIETKGAKLFKDTSQKFKAARNQWPQFRFEMFQRKKGTWAQLY